MNNPGNDAADSSRRAIIVYPAFILIYLLSLIECTFHLLTLLGQEISIVREDQIFDAKVQV